MDMSSILASSIKTAFYRTVVAVTMIIQSGNASDAKAPRRKAAQRVSESLDSRRSAKKTTKPGKTVASAVAQVASAGSFQ
jgi:hypothetical protein